MLPILAEDTSRCSLSCSSYCHACLSVCPFFSVYTLLTVSYPLLCLQLPTQIFLAQTMKGYMMKEFLINPKIFKAVTLKLEAFWVLTPWGFVGGYRYFAYFYRVKTWVSGKCDQWVKIYSGRTGKMKRKCETWSCFEGDSKVYRT